MPIDPLVAERIRPATSDAMVDGAKESSVQ